MGINGAVKCLDRCSLKTVELSQFLWPKKIVFCRVTDH